MIKEIIEKYKTSDDYLRWQYLSESSFDDLAADLQKYMEEEITKAVEAERERLRKLVEAEIFKIEGNKHQRSYNEAIREVLNYLTDPQPETEKKQTNDTI